MENNEVPMQKYYMSPSQIQSWTDSIFAFSMTLLIVGVNLPATSGTVTEQFLLSKLTDMLPTFLAVVQSFILIGIFWMVHHRQFQSISKSNSALIWINIILMLLVVFMPFTTNLIDDYGYLKTANFVFNLNMFLIGILFYVQYSYAASHGLLHDHVTTKHIDHYKLQNSIIAVASFIALVLGQFSPVYSSYAYLLIPAYLFLQKTKNN